MRAFQTFQETELRAFMVAGAHADVCKLRDDAHGALRRHFAPAVPPPFLRRYFPSGKGLRTSGRVRQEAEYRADVPDFKRAGMRAELAAMMKGAPTAGVAEAERARLRGYLAAVYASQDAVSVAVRALPKPLPLDEEMALRAEKRRRREAEEAEAFRVQQRAMHRARKKKAEEDRAREEAARARAKSERAMALLRAEEQWVVEAGKRSERVLTHFLQCLLALRVDLTQLTTPWALRVLGGLQHAFSLWSRAMLPYGELIDEYRVPVYDQLWETVEILSVGDTVTAYVDGSPFTTSVPKPVRAGGFCSLLREAMHMGAIHKPGFTFFKREALVSAVVPLRPQEGGPAPAYEAWRARARRAKTLPWHLLRKRKAPAV